MSSKGHVARQFEYQQLQVGGQGNGVQPGAFQFVLLHFFKMDSEETKYKSRITNFLLQYTGDNTSLSEVEAFFIVGTTEYRFRLRIVESSFSWRVTVCVARDKMNKFLDKYFTFYQELYARRVPKGSGSLRTKFELTAHGIVEKMKHCRACKFCPRILTEGDVCSTCSFSFNFSDICSVCRECAGHMVRLPTCVHRLHPRCIMGLLEDKCPVCRELFCTD